MPVQSIWVTLDTLYKPRIGLPHELIDKFLLQFRKFFFYVVPEITFKRHREGFIGSANWGLPSIQRYIQTENINATQKSVKSG